MIFNYWIDPDGMMHNAGEGIAAMHNEWAKKYLIEKNGEQWWKNFVLNDFKSPYQVLHEMGWVRMSIRTSDEEQPVRIWGNCIDLDRPMRNTMDPRMTPQQLRIAKMVCADEGCDFHRAINDKRFW